MRGLTIQKARDSGKRRSRDARSRQAVVELVVKVRLVVGMKRGGRDLCVCECVT